MDDKVKLVPKDGSNDVVVQDPPPQYAPVQTGQQPVAQYGQPVMQFNQPAIQYNQPVVQQPAHQTIVAVAPAPQVDLYG